MRRLLLEIKGWARKSHYNHSGSTDTWLKRWLLLMKSYLDTNQTGRFDSLVSLAATFAVPFLLLCSCVSVKPSTTKSGKKYFETFYVENGTQYFIKPLALSGLGSD